MGSCPASRSWGRVLRLWAGTTWTTSWSCGERLRAGRVRFLKLSTTDTNWGLGHPLAPLQPQPAQTQCGCVFPEATATDYVASCAVDMTTSDVQDQCKKGLSWLWPWASRFSAPSAHLCPKRRSLTLTTWSSGQRSMANSGGNCDILHDFSHPLHHQQCFQHNDHARRRYNLDQDAQGIGPV